ncbi:sigma-54-dependent transcriptional regulator [Synoicihabitans lomoniglobus]|uniref:Sigma-54 dependent transcriptional regulator n=1 Tax=Synoicihabitans lomoniglobus TaxID=2909285 RepID=A0AAF0I7R5_9BACT|nr:sigma-54 dependent transcriptional regulator [Opitutaceae bacterium LMO-M01]WED66946.1 sigma-54 dependent transcriptional regulator [Opitutaceae bacterium LMO-M01]
MPASAPRILIADDQPDVLEALRLLLKGEGYQIDAVKSPAAVLRAVESRDFALVLIDLNYARDTTSGEEGLELLEKLQNLDSNLPVVVMTAWASVEIAVEAMRRGARDFVTKPWDNPRLLAIVRNQVDLGSAVRAFRRLEQENQILRGKDAGPTMIAESVSMRPILDMIARVGPSDANILITGENGTGKGVVARALHAVSVRSTDPFISVNMGGLPEGIFESELFGHVRGAFTDAKSDRAGRFELADGGSLFMDEIGNIPLSQQAKILRTLETGEFERVGSSRTYRANVRLISATNADLQQQVADGKFRQDLLFRLNTIHIHLPPLRERREDIDLLAQHFLKQHVKRYNKSITGFDSSATEAMRGYTWPGNVRELDHAVERGCLMAQGKVIKAGDLGLNAGNATPQIEDMSIEEVEAYLIKKTLARCDGNARKAAEELGLSRSAFYRRLEKYGL